MTVILSFDPGEIRTGLAVGYEDGKVHCFSFEPWDAVQFLETFPLKIVKHVVLEQWVPYPGAQHGNAWRNLVEVKTLGALEWVCMRNGIPWSHSRTNNLEPTTALANADGYQWQAANRDEKAAEAHLYYYRNLREQETQ